MDYTTQNAEELAYIKANSAYSLPANPSQSGWGASQIREKLYLAPLYLLDLIQTYRNSSTSELESIEGAIEDITDGTTIVGKATHDALGNEIADTYISGVAFGSVSRSSTTNTIDLNCTTPIDSALITASVELPSATSTYAGLLSASDKGRIDGMVTGIGSGNYSGSTTSLSFVIRLYDDDHNIVAQYSQSLPEATTGHAGLLNSSDKTRLNNLDNNLSTLQTNVSSSGHTLAISGGSNTNYLYTVTLKDANGNSISNISFDLPLETVVVSGSYDSVNKKVILTLDNGSTIEFSVADLIDGLASQTDLTNLSNTVDTLNANAIKKANIITSAGMVTAITKDNVSYGVAETVNLTTIPNVVQSVADLPAENDGYLYLVLDDGYLYRYNSGWVQAYQYTSDLLTITEVDIDEE